MLDGIQMRFDLPGFLGQRIESGDEGLLFRQRRERDFNTNYVCHFHRHVGGALHQWDQRGVLAGAQIVVGISCHHRFRSTIYART